jgi:hypothetical protein
MVGDPYFSDTIKAKMIRGHLGVCLRRSALYPLLALSGCHMLATGSPVPLWHIERLEHPVAVTAVGDDALVLADGSRVRLPFIKRLPKGDVAFDQALAHGVEIGPAGEVFGIIDPTRMCGNDPVVFRRLRIDLSELAGVLDPDGIDDTIVHPEEIQFLKTYHSNGYRDRRKQPFNIMGQAHRMRLIFEAAVRKPKEEPITFHLYRED